MAKKPIVGAAKPRTSLESTMTRIHPEKMAAESNPPPPPLKKRKKPTKPDELASQDSKDKQSPNKKRKPSVLDGLHDYPASTIRVAPSMSGETRRQRVAYKRSGKAELYLKLHRNKTIRDPELRALWQRKDVQRAVQMDVTWPGHLEKAMGRSTALKLAVKRLRIVGLISEPYPVEGHFRLMHLPQEVRAKIIQLQVVEEGFFVWPNSEAGRDQPDLSRVCRQLRTEVLPVYYGHNLFAVDLTRLNGSTGRWLQAVALSGHLNLITRWFFDYAPRTPKTAESAEVQPDKSLVIAIHLREMVAGSGRTADVEVHRAGRCAKQGSDCCCVQKTPAWLNEEVFEILDMRLEPSAYAGAILQLAKKAAERVDDLVDYRCTGSVVKPETGCAEADDVDEVGHA